MNGKMDVDSLGIGYWDSGKYRKGLCQIESRWDWNLFNSMLYAVTRLVVTISRTIESWQGEDIIDAAPVRLICD